MIDNRATNGWNEWSKYVLKELERLNDYQMELNKKVDKLLIDTTTMKVKASLFGALAGAVPAIIMLIVWLVRT